MELLSLTLSSFQPETSQTSLLLLGHKQLNHSKAKLRTEGVSREERRRQKRAAGRGREDERKNMTDMIH